MRHRVALTPSILFDNRLPCIKVERLMLSSPIDRIFRSGLIIMAAGLVALATVTVGVLCPPQSHAATAGDVYVSPTGNDANPGTHGAPVRTLQRAQALVRGLNQNMTADVTVVLDDGFYRLTGPLALTAADSGTNGHNVIWTAGAGARPALAGSVQVSGWRRLRSGSPIW